MSQPIQLKAATLSERNVIDRSPLRRALPRVQPIWIIRGFLLIPLALAWLALSPSPNAFGVSPAPDGGYPNQNTAEGDYALFSLTTGSFNTAIGFDALYSNTTGIENTATGYGALYTNTGSFNTATGFDALFYNTTGQSNTANGYGALLFNETGSYNTANGNYALRMNKTGNYNTANGYDALFSNTTGANNTANGALALNHNTSGVNNTASGVDALLSNTTGYNNTANGNDALSHNTTGNFNTANGVDALFSNTTGANNTANGIDALSNNATGFQNTANGVQALYTNTTGNSNTAEGFKALLNNTGSNDIGLGYNAGKSLTTGSGNVCIGAQVLGVAGESNTTRIGNVYSSVASARAVYVNADNKIGTLASSRRFKDEIKPMDKASETILALKPVTFRYKAEFDPGRTPMFGLVAEEVEQVNPDLVTRDADGKPYTVRYEAVNAMLLNEFLKEHDKVQALEATAIHQQKQIEALTAGLQKVSAQIEASKPATQMATNNQ